MFGLPAGVQKPMAIRNRKRDDRVSGNTPYLYDVKAEGENANLGAEEFKAGLNHSSAQSFGRRSGNHRMSNAKSGHGPTAQNFKNLLADNEEASTMAAYGPLFDATPGAHPSHMNSQIVVDFDDYGDEAVHIGQTHSGSLFSRYGNGAPSTATFVHDSKHGQSYTPQHMNNLANGSIISLQ